MAGLTHPRHLAAADHWAGLYVLLMPALPFLVLGLLLPLGGRPGHDVEGALTVLAWAGCSCLVPLRRHGVRVLSGDVAVLGACSSFVDSHIFWERGTLTTLSFAVGFGLLVASRTGDVPRTRATAGSLTNS
ncbi:hypothetical protein [Streptomyces sp. NBC_01314]|uniref:hypothetical protein n=1 Tax=Streptomyces sp. NBC_01314 TaxID=2903821 RepID=UPI003087D7DE|nr:hypothetical protein OG622_13330 [Streptomyces sp. NBC_01314]